MPTFKFRNMETGEEFEDFLSNSRREELLKKNPHIKQMPSMFSIAGSTVTTLMLKLMMVGKRFLQKGQRRIPIVN